MHACPYCQQQFNVRELPHQSWWRNYRLCPHCEGKVTVDKDTKIRQALFLIVACMSLVFTGMLYFEGNTWLLPSFVSYLVMGLALYWGTKHVRFVPYTKDLP